MAYLSTEEEKKRCVVVFGPTASGKSTLADEISVTLDAPTVLVDSMQVYREIPVITNQRRERPAGLAGITSVRKRWSVGDHRKVFDREVEPLRRFVVEGGTGMYLNAVLLDIELFPKVSPGTRREAALASRDEPNPRRAARKKELELAGCEPANESIWAGDLRFSVSAIYLRPPRETLDAAIEARSHTIASRGLEEARLLKRMVEAGEVSNPSVLDSVGVRELLSHLEGNITLDEAEEEISKRTKRLARRQLRWFDKLARTLKGKEDLSSLVVLEKPSTSMHDIIRTW